MKHPAPQFSASAFIRITPDQKTQFIAAARAVGLNLSTWMRQVCLRASKKASVK
jgi:uncharacterized protein (DUF1778 family)